MKVLLSELDKVNVFQSFLKKSSTPSSARNEIERPDIHLLDLFVTPTQFCILLENVLVGTIAYADGTPPFVLKIPLSHYLLVHLLFNDILSLRKWPTIWKRSFITPIPKKESKNKVRYYLDFP